MLIVRTPHGWERVPPDGRVPELRLGLKRLQGPPDGDEGCRMRDAGDQPKTFMSSAPTLPATVAIAASAEIPPRPPVLGLLKGADADILHGQPLAVILELGDHDVVEALVRARDLGLEPESSAFTSPISRTSCTSSFIAPPPRP